MSESLDVDVSSGLYEIEEIDGVRFLNGWELSIDNRHAWDRLYEIEAENSVFPTGYDYAVQVYEAVDYALLSQDVRVGATSSSQAASGVENDQASRDPNYQPPSTARSWESAASRSEWDTFQYRQNIVDREEAEAVQFARDANGIDANPEGVSEGYPEDQPLQPRNPPTASDLINDPNYGRIVNGWNQKLNASSEDLSGLVPFCELYAVFDQGDIIAQEDSFSTRYTSIKSRMVKVRFSGTKRSDGMESEPALPQGLSRDGYIVKVAGDNKSQLEPDSAELQGGIIPTDTKSYKGLPGIGDLSVSRGSAAAQNVKYDLSITMPNPELINERFEYSKLMLMNSPFLIIYGWNIRGGNFDADYYPPTMSKDKVNDIIIGNGIGGFWSAAVINLSNFNFSFDSVGHLVGKLTFLNSSGIFLGTLTTAAVGNTMLDQISEPSEAVISRVGGEDNQDFIWQNGIPWSAIPADTRSAEYLNSEAGKREALSNYFNPENKDSAEWTEVLEKALEPKEIDAALALKIRENISALTAAGENFLEIYRVRLINNLFQRKRSGIGDQLEVEKMASIIEMTGWKKADDGWWNDDGVGPRGELYGPGDDEDANDADSDKVIDGYFEYQIKNAWNAFFKYRFENLGRLSENQVRNIPVPLVSNSEVVSVPAGISQSDFTTLVTAGTDMVQIVHKIPSGRFARLLPSALESMINAAEAVQGSLDSENSFIRNMPPFGQELQNTIVNDFQNPSNLNYNNFYSTERKVADMVMDLIETTSVISIPVPVSEDNRLSLQVERRSYSEVFGIEPSDGKKASVPVSKDVMIEFEFLNDIAGALDLGRWEFNATLSKITFYNNQVLYSLKNTKFEEWATETIETFSTNDTPIVTQEGGFNNYLQHVITNGEGLQGRFVAKKYAVLKNGWIVSQSQQTAGAGWKDDGPARPIFPPESNEPTGLFFLKNLLPTASVGIAAESIPEGMTSEEHYLAALQRVQANKESAAALALAAESEYATGTSAEILAAAAAETADLNLVAQVAAERVNNFESILILENAISSAAVGSQILDRVDAGTANQDEIVIADDVGETVHSVFRQPVYFFLGSVLESLRIATNDKVKFFYSEIVPRKQGEPFYISIPEGSSDSVQATYDAQIANLERELAELGSVGWREANEGDNLVMVENSQTQDEIDADKVVDFQTRWDNALVDYITHRGQDAAYFGEQTDRKNNNRAAGVYRSYTNIGGDTIGVRQRLPNLGFTTNNFPHYRGGVGIDREFKTDSSGVINIRAPWIYRIGGRLNGASNDPYYAGPDDKYLTAGGNRTEGRYGGWMRLWRPEDLNAALDAFNTDRTIYYRETHGPESNNYASDHNLRLPNALFSTDSFGETTGPVDYGYSNAFTTNGGDKDDSGNMSTRHDDGHPHPFRDHDFRESPVGDKNRVIQGLLGWLNWWPKNRASGRYSMLGQQRHRTFGRSTARHQTYFDGPALPRSGNDPGATAEEVADYKTKLTELHHAGWYLINWPKRRAEANSQGIGIESGTEEMYVRGLVVQDFISLNGPRPTGGTLEPLVGSTSESNEQREMRISSLQQQVLDLEDKKKEGSLDTQFKRLPIRTTYEIPVNINTIKQFLTSEPRAPLHKLLKKVVDATKETIPAIQLSMRPAASNPTYIDIFPSAMNYDGIIQEVFTEVDVGSGATDASDTMGIKNARASVNKGRMAQSEKVIVCQFGTAQSLVESFGLSSKIDPNAFSAFRLPAVVGGASMNVIEVLRNSKITNPGAYSDMLSDFGDILDEGLTTGMEALKKLQIVGEDDDGGSTFNSANLENFLLSESHSISKAASSFLEDMMSQNVKLYNTILTLQNEFFTNKETSAEGTIGVPGTRQAGSKFYGNILSTFLRTANLTIHGTTGLSVFNLVYLKGLLNGIEGLYLISSVNESLAVSTFTTTLECKLIEYTNNDPQTNPIAYRGEASLNRLASIIDETKARENKEFGADYSLDRLGAYLEEKDTLDGALQ